MCQYIPVVFQLNGHIWCFFRGKVVSGIFFSSQNQSFLISGKFCFIQSDFFVAPLERIQQKYFLFANKQASLHLISELFNPNLLSGSNQLYLLIKPKKKPQFFSSRSLMQMTAQLFLKWKRKEEQQKYKVIKSSFYNGHQ